MASPVGHSIAALAAAFFSNSVTRRPSLSPRLLLACAAVGVAPDLDLLVRGAHRTCTHSIGGVAVVAFVSWLILRRRRVNAGAAAAAIGAAHASHLLLDWFSRDTSPPAGLMVLWPFSTTFFISGVSLFAEISRRYWRVDEFLFSNVRAAVWELFVLAPILLVAWVVWSAKTLKPFDR